MENSFVVRSLHSEEIEISCLGYGELTAVLLYELRPLYSTAR